MRFRQALWPLNVTAAVLGVLCCLLVLSSEGGTFGRAWIASVAQARSGMAALFGAQATIFGIGLSLTMLALQNAATQFSPRLLGLYVRFPQVRWVIAFFVFSVAFDLVAAWALGLEDPTETRTRPILAIAFVLLFAGAGLLPYQILTTIRSLGPETILAALTETACQASRHLLARRAHLRLEGDLGAPPRGARPLFCVRSGYLADVDFDKAIDIAASGGLRVWFTARLGAWLEIGERIGWAEGAAEPGSNSIADCLITSSARGVDYDVAFRIRLLRDVGVRALSPAVNDPSTARLALRQIRTVLRMLPAIGARWVIADRTGFPRLSVDILDEAECLSIGIEGISRYGASDPEVLEEVVLSLQDAGTRIPSLRAHALAGLRRVRGDAATGLDPGRAARLTEGIDRAERAIQVGAMADVHQPAGGFLYT